MDGKELDLVLLLLLLHTTATTAAGKMTATVDGIVWGRVVGFPVSLGWEGGREGRRGKGAYVLLHKMDMGYLLLLPPVSEILPRPCSSLPTQHAYNSKTECRWNRNLPRRY